MRALSYAVVVATALLAALCPASQGQDPNVATTTSTTATTTAPSPPSDRAHHLVHRNTSGNICFMLAFEKLFVMYDDEAINATAGTDTDVYGNCFQFEPQPDGNYSLSAEIGTTLVLDGRNVTAMFTFEQNATYSTNDSETAYNNLNYGDQSSALSNIVVTVEESNGTKVDGNFTQFGKYDMAMDNAKSYKCKYNFTYHSNTTEGAKAMNLTVYDVRVQPFIPKGQNAFSRTSDNSYCPRDDSRVKRIGLIVGGVLTGLALLGLVIFSITACRSDNDYQSLDNVAHK